MFLGDVNQTAVWAAPDPLPLGQQSGVVDPVWVSYATGSDQGAGTWESPLRRLAQGWAAVVPGGTIIMMGGEPIENTVRLGSDEKSARIEAAEGVTVRISP